MSMKRLGFPALEIIVTLFIMPPVSSMRWTSLSGEPPRSVPRTFIRDPIGRAKLLRIDNPLPPAQQNYVAIRRERKSTPLCAQASGSRFDVKRKRRVFFVAAPRGDGNQSPRPGAGARRAMRQERRHDLRTSSASQHQ